MVNIIGCLLVFVFFASLFAGLSWSRHTWELPLEGCRKVAHVGMGLASLSFPFFVSTSSQALCLAFLFSGALVLLRLKHDLLWGGGSILPASRCDSEGEFYFVAGITVAILFARHNHFVYFSSILMLTFADTAAAFVGRWLGRRHCWSNTKTLEGSFAFFLVGCLCLFCAALVTKPNGGLLLMGATCLLATLVEGISKRGSDNLGIPLVCVIGLQLPLWLPHSAYSPVILLATAGLLAWVLFKKFRADAGGAGSRSWHCDEDRSECVSPCAPLSPQPLAEPDEAR